jgi:RHS repeat-associated protein
MKKLILLSGLFILFPFFLCAQTGLPPFGSFTPTEFETINNQNLNVNFAIPIVSSPGRSLPLSLNLTYNSLIWQKVANNWTPVTDASGNPTWGWQKDFPAGGSVGYYSFTQNNMKCEPGGYFYPVYYFQDYVYVDSFGTSHTFPVDYYYSTCPAYNGGTYAPAHASDGSGYLLSQAGNNPIVIGPNGQTEVGGTFTASDANGNYVTKTAVSCSGCVETDWTDSVGNKALKIIYTPNTTSPTSVQYEFLDGTGNYQTITLKLQSYNIKTNFSCSGVGEYTGTAYLPYELDIPSPVSGTIVYGFYYEASPNNTGYYTGRLLRLTLPTGNTSGGYYQWAYSSTNDGINCSDGTTLGMVREARASIQYAVWNFVRNTSNLTTTVTIPALSDTTGNHDTVFTFNSSGQEISRKMYANSPGTTLLRTVNTTWATNGTPSTQLTILEDNSTQSEIATIYDSNGLLDSVTEYDWGSGTPGSPFRTTAYTYQTNSNYTAKNLINLLVSKVVKDGSGTTQYRQDIAYDGTALASCPPGVAQHDDTNYSCNMNYRGNPTAVTTYTSPSVPSGGITKNFTYDWFGNLLTAQLNCCTSKTWAYSGTTQYSQPDSVTSGTSPTQLTTSYLYNLYLGLMTKSTDPNNLVTNYSYDFLRRPTQVSQVNGSVNGKTISYSYSDTAHTTTTTTTIDLPKSISVKQVRYVDRLGHPSAVSTEDINGNVVSTVNTGYDYSGRLFLNYNPYVSGSYYITQTKFDALGRPISITFPDSSIANYTYAEQYTTITDSAGKQRKYQSDAAGRLVAVTEPDSGNNLVNTTYYTYTVLDALTTVADAQNNPTQTRTNTYDALGRLIGTVTPEGGQTCFGTRTGSTCNQDGYDSFDNLLTRTDARGVVTSYTYDTLNRLKGVSYNVGSTGVPATASVSFTYGTNASQFNNGALITMTDGVGSENYTYNGLEQLTQLQKVISGTTYTTNYSYNVAGELTQITYPSGRVVQQSVDAIGRLCEVAPSTTGCGTASSPYATGYGYNAASQVTGFKYGNGIYASLGFSPDRLQLNCLDYSTTNRNGTCAHDSTTKFGLTYGYPSAPNNNGSITSITDSVDNGRTVAYTYDPLSRLSTAVTTGSTNYPQWGLSWGYDRYGNRLNQTLTAGSGYQGSVQVTASSNRINCIGGSGQSCTGGVVPTYDSHGNMTYDGTNTVVYDAENHATSATNQSSAGTYTYDGNAHRVKKVSGSTTTVYIFSASKVIAEYDNGAVPTAPSREYVYGGGTLLAKIDSSGTKYYHQDQLSNRLVTDSSGNTYAQMGHYPFGDPWYNATNDKLYFTTYERDSESSNDYAMARYYVWRIARFVAPDPLSGSTGDPQSLNHYTYAANDPISNTDPSGACIPPGSPALAGVSQGFQCPPSTDGDNIGLGFALIDLSEPLGPIVAVSSDGIPSAEGEWGIFTVTFVGFSSAGGGNYGMGGGGGRDPRQQAIERARSILYDPLSGDPDCLGFLNGRGANPLAVLGTIPINHDYIGGMSIQAQTTGNQPNPNSLVPQHPSITVNDNGWFFTRGATGTDGVNTGTLLFQGSILLHELGHATGVLLYDGEGPNALANQATNAEAINSHCQKTLGSLSNN